MSTPYAMLALEGGGGAGSPQRGARLLWRSLRVTSHCVTYAQELGAGILKTQAQGKLQFAAFARAQVSIRKDAAENE